MATYQDGNVRKATPNTVAAMKRNAEARRCPNCDRKSAMGAEVVSEDSFMRIRERTCRYCGFASGVYVHQNEDDRWVVTRVKMWPDGRREEETR